MDIELYGLINSKLKGKASLVNGKVPAEQLPSYVDDVINGYLYDGKFYEEDTYETEITPEDGKIYVDLATNITYRWSGLAYIQIGGGSVEANPTLVGTEPDLEGLQIGDAKYKVPKGSYVVTASETGYITSDEFNYINSNFEIVPCFVAYAHSLFRISSKDARNELYADIISNSLANNSFLIKGLYINKTNYMVTMYSSQAKKVDANPTLAGTESDLEGLQVGSTKYVNNKLTPIHLASSNGTLSDADFEKLVEAPEKYYLAIDNISNYGNKGCLFYWYGKITKTGNTYNGRINFAGVNNISKNNNSNTLDCYSLRIDRDKSYSYGVYTSLGSVQEYLKKFTNVSASNWVSDLTVEGFSYKCDLSCDGITANSLVYVKFGDTEVASGNYSSVVETGSNKVTIWSKVNTSITIPLIKEI